MNRPATSTEDTPAAVRGREPRLTMGRLTAFWAPLSATWLMMSLEGPFLAAVIARLADPKENLAAYGVAFAFAIIVEAPVIMMLSASTALVEGRGSYLRLRNFANALNAGITAFMVFFLLPPVFDVVARSWMDLPPVVADLSHASLLILLPWPAAIGYRRFYQGLLIRGGRTRRVAYGTVVRLTAMAATAIVCWRWSDMPGAGVGAAALSAGVCAEAVASRIMAREAVRELKAGPDGRIPAYPEIIRFYWPLAMTSTIGLTVMPMTTFFMGQARMPLESLAVLPVINSFSFIFRSAGLSYQEVAIAQLGRDEGNFPLLVRFAAILAAAASGGLALVAFTPLAGVWFEGVSGLSPELAAFAILPTRIIAIQPALSVLLSLQRAILVHGRRTAPITWATVAEVGGIALFLLLAVKGWAMVGAVAAAWAFLVGRCGGNILLLGPCAEVRRSAR